MIKTAKNILLTSILYIYAYASFSQTIGKDSILNKTINYLALNADSIVFKNNNRKIPHKLRKKINELSKERVKFRNPGKSFRNGCKAPWPYFVSNKSLILVGYFKDYWFILYNQGSTFGINTYCILARNDKKLNSFADISRIILSAQNKDELIVDFKSKNYSICPKINSECSWYSAEDSKF